MRIDDIIFGEGVTVVYLMNDDFACRVRHDRKHDKWDYTIYEDDEWISGRPADTGKIDAVVYWMEGVWR